jgi:DoxX
VVRQLVSAWLVLPPIMNTVHDTVYFFWQLFPTGQGKLTNIGKVSEFFTSLGIPLPTLNAYFIGSLECFGSLLLIIGLTPVASDRDLDDRCLPRCEFRSGIEHFQ